MRVLQLKWSWMKNVQVNEVLRIIYTEVNMYFIYDIKILV